jgi:hypothetical protein
VSSLMYFSGIVGSGHARTRGRSPDYTATHRKSVQGGLAAILLFSGRSMQSQGFLAA